MLGVRANRVIACAVLSRACSRPWSRCCSRCSPARHADFALTTRSSCSPASSSVGSTARPGDARRLHHRLRQRVPRRRAPHDQSQYLPSFLFAAVILSCSCGRAGSSPATAARRSACEARRWQLAARRSLLVARVGAPRHARLGLDAGATSSTRSSRSPSSSPCTSSSATRASSRSGISPSSRSARGRQACSRCRGGEAGDHAEPRRLPRAHAPSATFRRSARRARRRRLRARRRSPADAPLGPRRRYRDVRASSRSRTTSSRTTRRSGPG